jgi:hypothetical protein
MSYVSAEHCALTLCGIAPRKYTVPSLWIDEWYSAYPSRRETPHHDTTCYESLSLGQVLPSSCLALEISTGCVRQYAKIAEEKWSGQQLAI